MPLNWKALYPQIPQVVEAEVARRRRLAEQVSAVADKLAEGWLMSGAAEPAVLPSPRDWDIALLWLGAAVRAWEAVQECHRPDSPDYLAAGQRRQQLQQLLLRLLRQAG